MGNYSAAFTAKANTLCTCTISSQGLKKEGKEKKKKKRSKQNSHDTEDVSCTVQHVVKDNDPQSGPVVRFLHGEPLA